jgi:hypothetical protein
VVDSEGRGVYLRQAPKSYSSRTEQKNGGKMGCVRCQDLERAVDALQIEYNAAVESSYYRVSRKFAAYVRVELENARNELEEHRLVCTFAVTQPRLLQTVAPLRNVRQEELRSDPVQTAA